MSNEDIRMVVVPRSLDHDITSALDKAYAVYPEAAVDRESHHNELLNFFYDNGYLPEFNLKKKNNVG
jgi:hypothetical protein